MVSLGQDVGVARLKQAAGAASRAVRLRGPKADIHYDISRDGERMQTEMGAELGSTGAFRVALDDEWRTRSAALAG